MSQTAKINRDQVEDMLALTPMQQGLLYHYLASPGSDQYVEQLSLWIEGDLNVENMKQALISVINNNEMLRTVFRWEQVTHPIQIILKSIAPPLIEVDLTGLAESEREEAYNELLQNDRKQGMDISVQPFRVLLCKLDKEYYAMAITAHHLLYDGWSQSLLLKELLLAYEMLSNGMTILNRPKTKFKTFLQWQKEIDSEVQIGFWRDYLKGFNTKTQIKLERKIDSEQQREYGKTLLELPPDVLKEIYAFLNERGLTLAVLIYACWGLLLQRYNSSDDILFGTTVAGRPPDISGIDEIIGLFINTVPLRVVTEEHMTVMEFLANVDVCMRKRSTYEDTSLVDIASSSELNNADHLFDSIVVIENYPVDRMIREAEGSLRIKKYDMFERTHYDFTLVASGHESLQIMLHYSQEACSQQEADLILEHLFGLLTQVTRNPEMKVHDVDMVGNTYLNMFEKGNDTFQSYPYSRSIPEAFEEQVSLNPDQIALKFADIQLTYRELNEKANQLAWYLQGSIRGNNRIVGLMIERSPELIISLLAILKAGHTYLPIDPDYPEDRIRYMLEQSQAAMILTTNKHMHKAGTEVGSGTTEWIEVEAAVQQTSYPKHNLLTPYDPEQLIYILYTSGSTGNPKGVMVKSHAFVNLLYWFIKEFEIQKHDNTLFIAPISFDLAQKNIFGTLIAGGCLVLFEPGIYDYHKMSDQICKYEISLVNCAPSAFYPLIEFNENSSFNRLRSLRHVFLGGEPIQLPKLASWLSSDNCFCEIVNTYGPTECTDIASFYRVDPSKDDLEKSVPIGKPIYNAELYVTDHRQRILPPGVIGELCIGGVGLAAGYYNDPQRTAERFNQAAYSSSGHVYRTGDLVRWLPDGNLEYLGRRDEQTKINGMRVELGEIEMTIRRIDGIKDAVVSIHSSSQNKIELVAYLVMSEEISFDELRDSLSNRLPLYMIPTLYVRMDRLPLSPNGKIDRKALPKPEVHTPVSGGKPINEIEESLVSIWRMLLSNDEIGTNDSFFDVGGNSLLLIQLHAKIHKIYPGMVEITDLFAYPNVSKLASYITNQMEKEHEEELQLLGVRFPDEYYLENNEKFFEHDRVESELSGELVDVLSHFCHEYQVQLDELWVGMILYLLSEITGQQNLTLYAFEENHERFIPIQLEVQSMDNFNTLFKEVGRQLSSEVLDRITIPLDLIEQGATYQENGTVPILFCSARQKMDLSRIAGYGLVIEVVRYRSFVTVEYMISNRKFGFKKGKVKEILNSYVQLLKQLASEYRAQAFDYS